MNAAFFVGMRTCDVYPLRVVVKGPAWQVSKVPETIPLRARLSVHVVNVIVGDVFGERFDLVVKRFAVERRLCRFVQGQAAGESCKKLIANAQCYLTYFTGTISPV